MLRQAQHEEIWNPHPELVEGWGRPTAFEFPGQEQREPLLQQFFLLQSRRAKCPFLNTEQLCKLLEARKPLLWHDFLSHPAALE